MLACCSYLKIRIQIKFTVFYCFVWYLGLYVCVFVCDTITEKIRHILIQNFAHTFAIVQGRFELILVQFD